MYLIKSISAVTNYNSSSCLIKIKLSDATIRNLHFWKSRNLLDHPLVPNIDTNTITNNVLAKHWESLRNFIKERVRSLVSPLVNKTGFNLLIIETNALLGKRWEVAGCCTFYLFLKNFAETYQHIAS